MAISTFKTFLMKGTTSGGSTTYEKLVNITSFPDLGGAPEMLETTTTSDPMQTFIKGIDSSEAMEFEANYDKTDFQTLKALTGTNKFAVWFGATVSGSTVTPDGSDGKFSFEGQLSVRVSGGGVNEVAKMVITIAPSTPIEFSAS